MAKQGIYFGNVPPVLQTVSNTTGWALCIGAGTSLPIFPSWNELVHRLVELDVGTDEAVHITQNLLDAYSPDAIIQGARDRLNLTQKDFANLLAEELYTKVKSKFKKHQWNRFTRMISSHSGQHEIDEWLEYLDLVNDHLPPTSAYPIAQVVAETVGRDIAPTAILSFNAEPYFASLTNACWRLHREKLEKERKGKSVSGRKIIDIITESVSMQKPGRIPYFFCHGLLPVPVEVKRRRLMHFLDKLVFSEADYLQLANATYSWQATVFTNITSSRTVVFVGVSLSDPNMRRWLSLVHSNRSHELEKRDSFEGESAVHYWINKRPDSNSERRWLESIVAHLGIRIIWIRNWDQIGDTLHSMLGT